MNSHTLVDAADFYVPRVRGDEVTYQIWGSDEAAFARRVVNVDRATHTYTVREYHEWRLVEWLHSHWEEWWLW